MRDLERPEQLGLQLERQGADLVEEQGAAVRQLEQARLGGDRAGEGALLVAEQLALEQVGRDRGAVDLDERLAPRAGSRSEWPGPAAPCRFRSRRR